MDIPLTLEIFPSFRQRTMLVKAGDISEPQHLLYTGADRHAAQHLQGTGVLECLRFGRELQGASDDVGKGTEQVWVEWCSAEEYDLSKAGRCSLCYRLLFFFLFLMVIMVGPHTGA